MKLSKAMKEEALRRAMQDIFEKRAKALVDKTNVFLGKVYDARYGADVIKILNLDLEHDWMDNLHSGFKIKNPAPNGYNDYLSSPASTHRPPWRNQIHPAVCYNQFEYSAYAFEKPRPLPTRESTTLELTVARDIAKAQNYRAQMDALCEEEKNLSEQLWAFLQACNTLAHIEANWAVGLKYFPNETPKKLPIPLIDDVRKALKAAA